MLAGICYTARNKVALKTNRFLKNPQVINMCIENVRVRIVVIISVVWQNLGHC